MRTDIERLASNILDQLKIAVLPIPVEEIIKKRGVQLKPYDLGDGVSGILIVENGIGTIGFNPTESEVRKRFTLAHELGHFELHKRDQLFIDNKKNFILEFRNQKSSTGELQKEQDANAFAAALLMPEKILMGEIQKRHFNLTDDESIKELAELFNVSSIAMTYRISNLGLF
ncbi:MAG: ImmA/IrrE family metallo-endopeptidase [Chitinophagales bacterium]